MSKKTKSNIDSITIVEAVETLSNIADLDFEQEKQVHEEIVPDSKLPYQTLRRLSWEDADATVKIIKDIFHAVLQHVKYCYKNENGQLLTPQTVEGIKAIMVLVGEAAKKMDRWASFFKNKNIINATDLQEYKQLQDFYQKKINRQIDENVLSRWILGLTRGMFVPERKIKVVGGNLKQTKHVFVDLDSVKKDMEYELFFIRKEDGTRFFSPRLIRNIKLMCDFGDRLTSVDTKEDILANIFEWQDKCAHIFGQQIMKGLRGQLERFCRETANIRDNDLIADVRMGLMALMLSANSTNLAANHPVKCCGDYFHDFQVFLRRALVSREYQKLVAYPPQKENKMGLLLETIIHNVCLAFFTHLDGYRGVVHWINSLVSHAHEVFSGTVLLEQEKTIANTILQEYMTMSQLIKVHSSGPLNKVLDFLQEGEYNAFDTIMQHNIPNRWFDWSVGDHKMTLIRLPCPIRQEFIHKVAIDNEFKEFLRTYSHMKQKHLIFDLQDRTSWREHFRSVAIEELQRHPDFVNHLCVVTLAIDTDFYHQQGPYQIETNAEVFLAHLVEHLEDESGGCFFPPKIKALLFPDVIAKLIDVVHCCFFDGKAVLSQEERMDFIQLIYLFIELKVVELVEPDSFSFSCKDGIDIGGSHTALFYLFLNMANEEKMNDADIDLVRLMLYAPPLLIRERLMLFDRFQRMLNACQVVEQARSKLGFKRFAETMHQEFGKLCTISTEPPLLRKAA